MSANPDARQRQQSSSHALPDYTRFSPAKIALRRHLNQDPNASAHMRGPGLATHRLVGTKSLLFSVKNFFALKIYYSIFVYLCLLLLGNWVVLTLHLEPSRTAPLQMHLMPRILLEFLRG